MPVAPPLSSSAVASVMFPRPDGGIGFTPGQTQSGNPNANPNAQMQLVGTDAQPFSIFALVDNAAQVVLTFPNLAVRNTQNNPLDQLKAQQNPLDIGPNDHLVLTCYIQGETTPAGVPLSVTPQAQTKSGAIAVGPFLGSEVFRVFQAVVKVRSSPVYGNITGIVAAHLTLALG